MGFNVWYEPFLYLHTLCPREVKALARPIWNDKPFTLQMHRGPIQRGAWDPPPEKSQFALCYLGKTGTDPPKREVRMALCEIR